jgi:DNA-binding PadR family transcriptional regulator
MGSIQAAIKKLIGKKYIVYSEIVENGKYKKVYTITDEGKEYFNYWINTPLLVAQNKHSELAKLYFMGLSNSSLRLERIEKYIIELKKQKAVLDTVYEQGKRMQVEEPFKELFKYQLLSAQYGIDMIQFEIDWYEKLTKEMR